MFEKDYAVRSDYYTDDAYVQALRDAAFSDLPPNEKLDLLTEKLAVLRREDRTRPVYCALRPLLPKRWRQAACRWGFCR